MPPGARAAEPVSAIALVGFMGAGKTTVGQALARRLGWRFQDLDQLIEDRAARTIEQIFEHEGETGFRELEYKTLRRALDATRSEPLVLALGGGAFIEERTRELLRRAKVPAIFLDASAEELFQRCAEPGVVRPLRHNLQQFCALYEKRRPVYLEATLHVMTSGKEIEPVVEEIVLGLNLVPSLGARG